MKPQFGLTDQHFNTSFAPLCMLGHALWERGELDSLRHFDLIAMKTRDHTPGEKLLDAFLLIMAGYPSLCLLNTKLRPDPMLAQAWHRSHFADQSVVSRTLDAVTGDALVGLRTVSWEFWRSHSQLAHHDWRKRLLLDLDLTPLLASPRAEASTKGYLGKKTLPDGNWLG
jgi:hypothetical protein